MFLASKSRLEVVIESLSVRQDEWWQIGKFFVCHPASSERVMQMSFSLVYFFPRNVAELRVIAMGNCFQLCMDALWTSEIAEVPTRIRDDVNFGIVQLVFADLIQVAELWNQPCHENLAHVPLRFEARRKMIGSARIVRLLHPDIQIVKTEVHLQRHDLDFAFLKSFNYAPVAQDLVAV